MDVNKVGNSYDNYAQSEKVEGVAYLTYQAENKFETYVDFSLSELAVATDPVEEEEEEPEDTEPDSEVNVWFLVSSIVVAAVLVLAVISLIVRKAFVAARKKRNHATPNKNNKK